MNLIIMILKWICIGQAGILAFYLVYMVLFSFTQRILLHKVSDTRIIEKRFSAIYGSNSQSLFKSICSGFRRSMTLALIVSILFFFLGSQSDWYHFAALIEFLANLCIAVTLGSLFFEVVITITKPRQVSADISPIKNCLHKQYVAMLVLGMLFAFVNWFIGLS